MTADTHTTRAPSQHPYEGSTDMIAYLTTAHRQLRVFLVGLMLVLASTFLAGGPTAAEVMRPNVTIGAGGGGVGSTQLIDEHALNQTPGIRIL